MRFRLLALAAVAMSGGALAAAEPKQPTGKWVVNFADAQCIATRNYGTEQDPFYLVLKAPPLGDVLQIGVVWKGGQREATQIDGEIVFDNYPPIRTNLLEYGVRKPDQRALLVNLALADLAPMRVAPTIRIRARAAGMQKLGSRIGLGARSADVQLALSQTPALLKMMDTCAADLRKVWNVWDEKQPGPLKQGASGNLVGLFNSDDYPAIALFNEQMGSVAFVLLIDETGKVADCTVTETSGVAALDAQSCAIVKERGKFKPAIGVDGKPAKSSWFQRITWRISG